MSNRIANAPRGLRNAPDEAPISRLADRLKAMAPPLDLTSAQILKMPKPSAAVAAALSTSAAIAARADRNARRSRSITRLIVEGFTSLCALVPYGLVALAMRLLMARVFFLEGQGRISGPQVPISLQDFDFSFMLPLQVKAETFGLFITRYAGLHIPAELGAYVLSYAEFLLPICLLVGFASRFAALGLLIIAAATQVYTVPDVLSGLQIYWAAMLLLLVSRGPGALSIDHFLHLWARR